jgi:mono/diheme cytochrome c family protein
VTLPRHATWLVLLATAASAFAQDAPSLAEQGRRVYTSLCVRCHGLNLVSNGIGFDLRQFPKDGQERFRTSVSKGLRAMPAWEGVLKPGELDALWAYIGSVNGWD